MLSSFKGNGLHLEGERGREKEGGGEGERSEMERREALRRGGAGSSQQPANKRNTGESDQLPVLCRPDSHGPKGRSKKDLFRY